MTAQAEVIDDLRYFPILDHGFVGLLDTMGSDAEICEAARCSYGKGTKSTSQDRGLIRYLIKNMHTSPIEMVELKFHIKVPIFVMRQLVRHRTASLNEYSGRYSIMTDEMYMPDPGRIQKQSTTNKQGSGEELTWARKTFCQNILHSSYEKTFSNYENTLNLGLARELARIQLPVANYTELYWKIDLKNFFHFIKLRTDPHAQYEIRVLANSMYILIKPHFPLACEAFEEYWRDSVSLSATEHTVLMDFISYCVSEIGLDDARAKIERLINENDGMTEKEKTEFLSKLGIPLDTTD